MECPQNGNRSSKRVDVLTDSPTKALVRTSAGDFGPRLGGMQPRRIQMTRQIADRSERDDIGFPPAQATAGPYRPTGRCQSPAPRRMTQRPREGLQQQVCGPRPPLGPQQRQRLPRPTSIPRPSASRTAAGSSMECRGASASASAEPIIEEQQQHPPCPNQTKPTKNNSSAHHVQTKPNQSFFHHTLGLPRQPCPAASSRSRVNCSNRTTVVPGASLIDYTGVVQQPVLI